MKKLKVCGSKFSSMTISVVTQPIVKQTTNQYYQKKKKTNKRLPNQSFSVIETMVPNKNTSH